MSDTTRTQEKSMRDILFVLFRYKVLIIIIFLIAVGATLAIAILKPEMYESNAKILFSAGKTSPVELMTGVSGPSEINSELELLKSRGFAEAVVDKAGIEKILYVPQEELALQKKAMDLLKTIGIVKKGIKSTDPVEQREKAIKTYTDTIGFSIVPRSSVINISYQSRTPELAKEILETTLNVYMDKHIEMHTSAVSLQFLQEETDKLKKELAGSESELRRFQDEIDIVSLPEQQTFLLQRIEDHQTAIQEAEADISGTLAEIEKMRPNIDMRDKMRESEIKLEALYARQNVLKNQLASAKQELESLRNNEQKYLYLKRQVETKDENYRQYLSSLEQARIAQTLEAQKISNVSIMEKPTLILDPISRERKKTVALGLFLGIVGSIGLAFILDYLNHKVKTVEDVEKRLLFHNITPIPTVNTKMVLRTLNKQENDAKKQLLLPAKKMSGNVTVWLFLLPVIRECFDNIKNYLFDDIKNTQNTSTPKAPYVLAVTSSYRGEGVTSVATGIAFAVALYEGENVLLVDSNLHHPDVDVIAGINRPAGLFEMKVKKPLFQEASAETFDFFSKEHLTEYASSVKGPNLVDNLLPSMEKLNYKLIVLDLPSISEGVSAVQSSAAADGTIMVIQSEKVRREVAVRYKTRLEKSGAHIFGAVLNKRKFYIPQWVYKKF